MLQTVKGVLCIEGIQTGDGRLMAEGAITWVDPPLPLAWIEDGDQHVDMIAEAPQVGTIEAIVRVGNQIGFTGFIDDEIEEGAEMIRRMQAGSAPLGERFGLSIDPDDWEVELVDTNPSDEDMVLLVASGVGHLPDWSRPLTAAAGDGDPGGEVIMEDSADSLIARYTRLRIRGVTACSVAAFDGAYLELAAPEGLSVTVQLPATSNANGTAVSFAAHGPFTGAHTHPHSAFGSQGTDETHEHTHSHADDSVHNHDHSMTADGCEDCEEPLVAAGGPLLPPAEWFQNPGFTAGDGRMVRQPDGQYLCPLTVTADGQVFGHLAGWHSCHTGYVASCMTAPRSPSGYSFFNDGPLPTVEGETVHVGQLTMGCGHPNESPARPLNWKQAKAHYDGGPGAVQMADVTVGEDEFGIWFAGALRPDVTDEQVRAFRCCSVSGDWREVVRGKGLDLIAVAAGVTSEGFQIASLAASGDVQMAGWLPSAPVARMDDGRVVALVASGIIRQPLPWERALGEAMSRIDVLEARLARTETVTEALLPDAAERLVASIELAR